MSYEIVFDHMPVYVLVRTEGEASAGGQEITVFYTVGEAVAWLRR